MSLDYIQMKESFNMKLYYVVGGVVVLIIILSVYFIFKFDNKQKDSSSSLISNSLTAQAKDEYIKNMQAIIQSQPAMSTDQKVFLIKTMSNKLTK